MVNEIVTLALRLAIVVMCGIIVPCFKKWLDAKTENEKMERIKDAARTAVAAAEQLYNIAEKTDPDGTTRRKFAENAVKRIAYETGVALCDREVEEIVHAAVEELNFVYHTETKAIKGE